jgi:hypothetical protein
MRFWHELSDFGEAFIISHPAGYCDRTDSWNHLLQPLGQASRQIFRSGNVTAPDDGVEALFQQIGDELGTLHELGVMLRTVKSLRQLC